jgi:hypothetical protein
MRRPSPRSSCPRPGVVIIIVDDNTNGQMMTAAAEPRTPGGATDSHTVVVRGHDGRDVKINVPGPGLVDPMKALFEAEAMQELYDRSLTEPSTYRR